MARIAGVDIPRDKRVVISLTYVLELVVRRLNKSLKKQVFLKTLAFAI